MNLISFEVLYAFRRWRTNAASNAFIVLSLAIGIGASTVTFGLFDAVLLKPLAVAEPDQLLTFTRIGQDGSEDILFSHPQYQRFVDSKVWSGVIASTGTPVLKIQAENFAQKATGSFVTENFFEVLGVPSSVGRVFRPNGPASSGSPEVVISYDFWNTKFTRDPAIVGKSIQLNDISCTIIGVAAEQFRGLSLENTTDVWLPLQSSARWIQNRAAIYGLGSFRFVLMGRMARDIQPAQAFAAMTPHFVESMQQLAAGAPPEEKTLIEQSQLRLQPGGNGISWLRHRFSRMLTLSLVGVLLLWIVSCANASNMLMARALERRKELMVHLALGASRNSMLRQAIFETLLLAWIAGGLGIGLAYAGKALIRAVADGPARTLLSVEPDYKVFWFAAAISLGAALWCGLAPMLLSVRADLFGSLRESAPSLTGKSTALLRSFFIAVQVSLTVVLLYAAVVLIQSLVNLRHLDLGIDAGQLITFAIDPPKTRSQSKDLENEYRQLLSQLTEIPGVQNVSMSLTGPLWIAGRATACVPNQPGNCVAIATNATGPDYTKTVGLSVLGGRDFDWRDVLGRPPIGIVTQAMAKRLFGTDSPIGKTVHLATNPRQPIEIVGMIEDLRLQNLRSEPSGVLFMPYFQQQQPGSATVSIRVSGRPEQYLRRVDELLIRSHSSLNATQVKPLTTEIDLLLANERFAARLIGTLSLLSIGLACSGLFASISYMVARRQRDLGIMSALGAQPTDLAFVVLKQTLASTLAGIFSGLVMVLFAGEGFSSLLYKVNWADASYGSGIAASVLAMVALIAFVPVRRVLRLSLATVLRS